MIKLLLVEDDASLADIEKTGYILEFEWFE